MLKGKDLISIHDVSVQDIREIFRRAKAFRNKPFGQILKGKTLLMLFAKPSTRTRVSFEVAINHLGGDDIFLGMDEIQFSRGESLEDTARVLSSYGDGIIARLFGHSDILTLAQASEVPVINGLTNLLHPCQGLTDLFTIQDTIGLSGIKVVFLGDGNNNVCHSLMLACSKLGVDLTVSCPSQYRPNPSITRLMIANAKASGSSLSFVPDPKKAAKGADVLYTDTWVSMGKEKEKLKRVRALRKYQLNRKLLDLSAHAIVMHDLPAHRGQEITSEVMDSSQSVIFDQAKNRMLVEKGILSMIFS